MRHPSFSKWIPLALCMAFAPLSAAVAASPSTQDEATADDAHWLASTAAPKLASNGSSLNGRKMNGRTTNDTTPGGHTVRGDGGMSVVSIRLPGAERHAK